MSSHQWPYGVGANMCASCTCTVVHANAYDKCKWDYMHIITLLVVRIFIPRSHTHVRRLRTNTGGRCTHTFLPTLTQLNNIFSLSIRMHTCMYMHMCVCVYITCNFDLFNDMCVRTPRTGRHFLCIGHKIITAALQHNREMRTHVRYRLSKRAMMPPCSRSHFYDDN